MTTTVDFCGELFVVESNSSISLGRDGDIAIDDNPFLHRRFLVISERDSLAWLSNVGSSLTATVADDEGRLEAYLAPGARLPLAVERTRVWFTAGPTTYELDIHTDAAPFTPVHPEESSAGDTTMGRVNFTPDQRLLIVALCEPMLRRAGRGSAAIPSSAAAAERLGWTLTRFNRKLDNVCEKMTKAGIRGLHGGPSKLATSRRARLAEYAIAARFVTHQDLMLLDDLDHVAT